MAHVHDLQETLVRQLRCGILPTSTGEDSNICMPEAWARAAMLIRINSLAQGYSGIRPVLIQGIVGLLEKDIVPRIPLRGSISASGDLMPLAYLAGTLQGEQSVAVWSGSSRRIVTAAVALQESPLEPLKLLPKEGLAIINGTAVSTGVAALVMHDVNCLAVLSQILTAMSTEALCGCRESFDAFFSAVRPHAGQAEAARNIWGFLDASKLVLENDGLKPGSLRQDRYGIRTAPQWLGPVLEDLLLATRQVTSECNSVTDNPLFDPVRERFVHGGNFQAKAVTSAMEKSRMALQAMGQMLFAQCTELINPKLNRGLPPNLVADEPSQSYLMKPVDIMVAGYQSELSFLSNSVGSHVQSAEMSNQSINSLALIAARYTHVSADVLSHLVSAHLFALCQALDLRVVDIKFREALKPPFEARTADAFARFYPEKVDGLCHQLWVELITRLDETTTMDSVPRFAAVFCSLQSTVLSTFGSSLEYGPHMKSWVKDCSEMAFQLFHANIESYSNHPDATPFLGLASGQMYNCVRKALGVPFITMDQEMVEDKGIGSYITNIYQAIQTGRLFAPVMEILRAVNHCEVK